MGNAPIGGAYARTNPPMGEPQDLDRERIIAQTRAWVDRAVIGLNLCPFARAAQAGGRVRYEVSEARDPRRLLDDLESALAELAAADPAEIETTLLVAPWTLGDFLDFNDFLDPAEALLERMGLVGEIQIASFHPRYQFVDTEPDDIGNATNRSPWPTLHLLRESSIERAVAAGADADTIVDRNLRTLRELGPQGWARLMAAFRDAG
jgi:hypothetical protein